MTTTTVIMADTAEVAGELKTNGEGTVSPATLEPLAKRFVVGWMVDLGG